MVVPVGQLMPSGLSHDAWRIAKPGSAFAAGATRPKVAAADDRAGHEQHGAADAQRPRLGDRDRFVDRMPEYKAQHTECRAPEPGAEQSNREEAPSWVAGRAGEKRRDRPNQAGEAADKDRRQ